MSGYERETGRRPTLTENEKGRGFPRPLFEALLFLKVRPRMAGFPVRDDGSRYLKPACFITSAAKSSSTFSMPSPTARRTTETTSAPSFFSASATLTLVSST